MKLKLNYQSQSNLREGFRPSLSLLEAAINVSVVREEPVDLKLSKDDLHSLNV